MAFVAWLRLPFPATGTAWAEDAWVFLAGSVDGEGVFTPYQGYLHVVPRLISDLVTAVVPLAGWATAMAAASCIVVGLVGAGLYLCSGAVLTHRPIRVALAFLPALVPLAGVEMLGNAANLHTYLLFLLPWLLLARIDTWPRAVAAAVAGFLIGTTEIQALLFLPLALVGVRNPKRLPLLGAVALAALAQVVITLTTPRVPDEHEANTIADSAYSYAFQTLGGSWTTRGAALGEAVHQHGLLLVVAPGAFALLALLVWAAVVAQNRARIMLVALGAAGVLLWFAAVWVNPGPQFTYSEFTAETFANPPLTRYAAVSSLFLFGTALVAVDALLARRSWPTRVAAAVLAAAMLFAAVTNFSLESTMRSYGPVWSDQVTTAETGCRAEPTGTVRITAAPRPDRWFTDLPCSVVLRR